MAKKKSFEEYLERLEEIVDIMENNETGLNESVKLYKEGVMIYEACAKDLNKLEREVTVLRKRADGVFEEEDFAEEN